MIFDWEALRFGSFGVMDACNRKGRNAKSASIALFAYSTKFPNMASQPHLRDTVLSF
jgi:hypothetical protein